MMTENADKKREQIHLLCMDEMVPKDHLLRIIDKAIDWTFIYDLVKDKYSHDTGRPSMDPVTLIKIPLIQYLYGIKSMRQTVKEIEASFNHGITLSERKNIIVTGVKKIESFDNEDFLMDTTLGFLAIKGGELEIIKLDTYQGNVSIKGKIDSIVYTDNVTSKNKEESFLGKLFK